jgi:hypothetical protein
MTYVFFNPFFFYEPRMEILELNTRVAGDWSGASMHGHQTALAETYAFGVFHVSLLHLYVLTSK